MKITNKLLSIILTLVMVLTLVPAFSVSAFADVAWTQIGTSDCQYKIETIGQDVILTIGPTNGTSGTLPNDINSNQAWPWYTSRASITSVVIESGVTAGNSTLGMFECCSNLKSIYGLSNFDTSNVTNMNNMFKVCQSLTSLDLSSFDTSKVTDMASMFYDCQSLTSLDLSSFDTSNVTGMNAMFSGCQSLTSLDLSSFDTTKVENMRNMFNNCLNIKTITVDPDPDKWSIGGIVNPKLGNDTFTSCSSIVGGAGTTYSAGNTNYTYAHVDGGTSNPGYLSAKKTASITKNGVTTIYATVQKAIDVAGINDTVKIEADVTENITIASDDVLTLDLNGYVLSGTGSGSVITNSGTLTICDSNTSAQHYFKYSKSGAWTLDKTAGSGIAVSSITDETAPGTVIVVLGGCITGGNSSTNGGAITMLKNSADIETILNGGTIVGCSGKCGGAIFQNEGTIEMNSGAAIIGCYASESGGAIDSYATSPATSTVIMNGGSIAYCIAEKTGGGIYNREQSTLTMSGTAEITNCVSVSDIGGGVVTNGIFNMTGGTIKKCTAAKGGGVFVNSNARFTMTGGSVTGNTATTRSGGVEVKGSLTLGGNATVAGNKLSTADNNNIYLNGDGKVITVQSGFNGSVGVSTSVLPTDGSPVAITQTNSADYSSYFTSDNRNYAITNSSNVVNLSTAAASVTSGSSVTNYESLSGALNIAKVGNKVTLLADITESSITVEDGITLDTNGKQLKTTNGWTLQEGSVTYTDSIINGTDVTAMAKIGTVNGTIYASSGALDLRGVDLRLKGSPVLYGGTVSNPTTLDTLKATRVFFGDIYDGGGTQTIKNIVLENCTTDYRAALGVYYDTLTVDNVSVNATEGWYWNQQYQPKNYQMYTGFGGTLNINKSLTTGEYMNAGYSLGGTGITNLADGAAINCVDFQNTGNSQSGVTAEQAAQNIADGIVNVNGSGATLNAAALNNHAITSFGTVNLTSHPVLTTDNEGLYNVNYGTGAVLTIGKLNFLNLQGDTTKTQLHVGDDAKTIIGGLTSTNVGADMYVTGSSETNINKDGGNAVKFTGDIVFTGYANSDTAAAAVTMNLDSSDDYFTGSVKGTVSAGNRWGKWGSAVNGDETSSIDAINGMTLNMSNGSTWTVTSDSAVNTLNVSGSKISGKGLTIKSSAKITIDANSSIDVSKFENLGTISFDMSNATESNITLIDCSDSANYGTYQFVAGKDNGYVLKVLDNDLYAVRDFIDADPTYDVPVSGDNGSAEISITVSGNNAAVSSITATQIEEAGTTGSIVMDLTTLSESVTGIIMPKINFENIATSDAEGLEIRLPNGIVAVFDKEVLSSVAEQATGWEIQLVINKDSKAENSMTDAQKESVKEMNNPVVLDAYFTSNGQRISDFKGGEADITAEYPTEYPVRVWYVADNGEKTEVPCTYDGKTAKFIVTHFSHYVIEQLDGSSCTVCPQDDTCVYADYTDTDVTAWYHDGVHFCVENKYMGGYDDTTFGPTDTLSRGMIVQMLYNMEGRPAVAEKSSYSDVAEGKWYADAIAWAEDNAVVDGYGDGTFGPEDNITREQLAKIFYSYAKLKGYDVSASEALDSFTDAAKASSWAVESLKWAKAVKLINGKEDGSILDPTGLASRAEAATILYNFCSSVVK